MIPLHEPTFDDADAALVVETLRSTWVSTAGPFVDRFEREFAAFVGMRHGISVSNGTVGLQLALDVLRRQRGNPRGFDVIVPTLTFIATANAVVHAGGHPVFADTAKGSMNVDAEDVAGIVRNHYRFDAPTRAWTALATGRTLLAVMPAHLMGWTCDMARLQAACAELEVPILEDAAEALGCYEADGTHVGRHGIASVFSFNGNKILTTGGGGMIVTNDEAFARRAKHLSTTAKTDGLRFAHDEVGYNFRLVNILAALGCSQLQKLGARLERKRRIAELYRAHLGPAAGLRVHDEGSGRSNHWLVNVVFPSEDARERALAALMREDVQARPLWTPNHLQRAFAGYPQPVTQFPNATDLWGRCLSLPSSPQLGDDVIAWICGVVVGSQGARVPDADAATA